MKRDNKQVSEAGAPLQGNQVSDRQAIQAELDRRTEGQRLTPAQRRIAQCLTERSGEIGFLSSMELAEFANVSQPSVTRFAMALGFDGYLEMRKYLRAVVATDETASSAQTNRYQAAALAELANLSELAQSLINESEIDRIGKVLAGSRPLAVLGLRASAGLACQFGFYASKVHPDVRVIESGGSMVEDQLEQCVSAGGRTLLAFMLPLYPKETVRALEFARQIGMHIVLISDASYGDHQKLADMLLKARVSTRLVFDSHAAFAALVSVLLDAMCNNMNGEAQKRLEQIDYSSKKRKVFAS
ncbi:MurR/RpiR family transcriptional regulator [Bradyrhizobium sp. CCGUVB23]|uniref:MurR/RpiR family transcriptional regulator n=1 Tax=Bradyrhizobium sp. CCGUVB23 TaxID=2949630 RepID=UPI0020B44C2E|nr:MurR/RpiR family transcriptional regulator [Bradyrhizobium sp. CCGUVB23]MCP3461045.1 MurR/RpiR family transcriptional regulator [Bradyrhizobium sp. CCGUVB23]